MAGANSVETLPDSLSMIVGIVSVEAETISLSTGTWLAAGSFDVKIVTGISEFVTVVAFEMTTAGTDFTVLGSAIEA